MSLYSHKMFISEKAVPVSGTEILYELELCLGVCLSVPAEDDQMALPSVDFLNPLPCAYLQEFACFVCFPFLPF